MKTNPNVDYSSKMISFESTHVFHATCYFENWAEPDKPFIRFLPGI